MRTRLVLGVFVITILATTVSAAVYILSSITVQPAFGLRGIALDGVAIAASRDSVYLTWPSNKTGNWEVLFRSSNDSGNTFADKINLSNSTESDSTLFNGIDASDEGNVHVSWNDNKTGNVETYVRTSTDGGKTFGDTIKINGTGTGSQEFEPVITTISPGADILNDTMEATRMAVTGENVYVLSWDNKTGNWEVFLAESTDGGQTFGDTVNVSNSTNTRSDDAHIVAEEDNVYMTWWETAKNGTRTPLFVASNDNGVTFGPALKVAANGTIGGNKSRATLAAEVPAASTPTSTSGKNVNANMVSMVSTGDEGYSYQPDTIQVKVDDTVTWTNTDNALHTVTSGSGTDENMGAEFDSGMMSTGKTFEHIFTAAGEYPYLCVIHPDMVGKVIVS